MRDPSSTSSSERRRLFAACVLLAAPFLAAWAAELFVLPPNAFCFSALEAVVVHSLGAELPGPFYPSMVVKQEDQQGDYAGRTRLARHRRTLWVTDRHGFRYDDRGRTDGPYDAVLVGDSNVWSAVLTQKDLVGPRLERRLGIRVYPYATKTLADFLSDPRSERMAPKTVVYLLSERVIDQIAEPAPRPPPNDRWAGHPLALRVLVLADRVLKAAMLRSFQADLERAADRTYRRWALGLRGDRLEPLGFSRVGTDGRTLFGAVELAHEPPDDAALARSAGRLSAYAKLFAARGARLIFFPVPAKSTVEFATAGRVGPRDTLPRLRAFLRREGVEEIDALPPFLALAANGATLYEPDDSHWSPAGAALATDLIARRLDAADR